MNENIQTHFLENFKFYHSQKVKLLLENYKIKLENQIKEQTSNISNSIEILKEEEIKITNYEEHLLLDSKLLLENKPTCIDYDKHNITEEDIEKLSQNFEFKNIFYNKNYDEKELTKEIDSYNISSFENELPYIGYDCMNEIKRILIISHSGFISELLNVIYKVKNLRINAKNSTHNTGIYIIKVYCSNCGNNKCQNDENCKDPTKNRIEFDFIKANDSSHLFILKDELI